MSLKNRINYVFFLPFLSLLMQVQKRKITFFRDVTFFFLHTKFCEFRALWKFLLLFFFLKLLKQVKMWCALVLVCLHSAVRYSLFPSPRAIIHSILVCVRAFFFAFFILFSFQAIFPSYATASWRRSQWCARIAIYLRVSQILRYIRVMRFQFLIVTTAVWPTDGEACM